MIVLRKRALCRCGCVGWCTFHGALDYLRYCLSAAGDAVWPSHPHPNASAFKDGSLDDINRGTPMKYRWLLIRIKADWAEWVSTLGLPSWASVSYPCGHCFTDLASMTQAYDERALLRDGGMAFALLTKADLIQARDICLLTVTVDAREHRVIRGALAYDKRKVSQAGKGRCLTRDLMVGGIQLVRGDRLEPSTSCFDTGEGFDLWSVFPATFTFWRRSLESALKHHNPLMDIEGTGPEHNMIDILHALYGTNGPVQRFCAHSLWCLIDGPYLNSSGIHAETRRINGLQELEANLIAFYSDERKAGHDPTEMKSLTLTMIGTHDDPGMTIKGMEARWLARFCTRCLTRFHTKLDGTASML